MKIVLLYLRILKKHDPSYTEPLSYEVSARRFLKTYKQFTPKIPHELVVVNCGTEKHDGLFDGVATRYETFNGGGFDCGTYQVVGARQQADLVFGLNTHSYLWRHDWLEPVATVADECGKGVYGVTASYEQHHHLRTPAIAFHPDVIAAYPHKVETREQAAWFEAGPENFSLWADKVGYPSCLVTPLGAFCREDWRAVLHGFRNGNQSNCYVWDRHTDLYAKAAPDVKQVLERQANTGS